MRLPLTFASLPRPDSDLVLHPTQFVAARDDFVGRAPWPAADPLVGLLKHSKSRTRGSGADEGVGPTFWLRLRCLVGQLCKLQRRFHRRSLSRAAQPQQGRLETGQQDAILPHTAPVQYPVTSGGLMLGA